MLDGHSRSVIWPIYGRTFCCTAFILQKGDYRGTFAKKSNIDCGVCSCILHVFPSPLNLIRIVGERVILIRMYHRNDPTSYNDESRIDITINGYNLADMHSTRQPSRDILRSQTQSNLTQWHGIRPGTHELSKRFATVKLRQVDNATANNIKL